MNKKEIVKYQKEINNSSSQKIISWAFDRFGAANITLASSLGAEDQVLIDMMLKINSQAQIFTLDTGRLPQETYETIEKTNEKYNIEIKIIFPDTEKVEVLVNKYGPNLFYKSVENRRRCCNVRKVEPLKRAFNGLKAWVCGLRREQSITRLNLQPVEYDENFNLLKINPLYNWFEEEVWEYIKKNNVPFNSLHNQGFSSIGCAPCTRAIINPNDVRSGRWWWENPETKECGLHLPKGV